MGKNQKGGKGHKKGKNNNGKAETQLTFREDGQRYGVIIKLLGGCHFKVAYVNVSDSNIETGYEKIGVLCGSMRKKVFVNLHDLVLISERDFQTDKVDIIHKYQPSEVSSLKKYKELEGMENLLKCSVNDEGSDDDNLIFDDEDEDIFEGNI